MVTQLPLRKIVRSAACRPAKRRLAAWHIAMFIAALGLVLRALVPAGFMPDARALQDGHIELTLCSPASAGALRRVTIQLSSDDASTSAARQPHARSSPSDSLATSADCPFGLMTAQAMMAPSSIAIAGVSSEAAPGLRIAYDLAAILPVRGPPLGSRAPPALT